ncbi:hypothetical protein ACVIGB_000897 [Bradyrhizobium sp. USDA 4341]
MRKFLIWFLALTSILAAASLIIDPQKPKAGELFTTETVDGCMRPKDYRDLRAVLVRGDMKAYNFALGLSGQSCHTFNKGETILPGDIADDADLTCARPTGAKECYWIDREFVSSR